MLEGYSDDYLILKMEINELRASEGLRPLDATDEVDTRTCLRCGESFKSEWSGNRICPDCSAENAKMGEWAEGITEQSHLESDISLWTVIDTNQLKAAAKARHVVMEPWVKHMFADTAKQRVKAAPSHYRQIEHNLADSKIEYGNQVKGLVISSSHLLPHPCDIQPLPDDILKIRAALRRRNLQCFEVSEPLTEAQVRELDRGLEENHSWILLSPHVDIDTEMFKHEVVKQ